MAAEDLGLQKRRLHYELEHSIKKINRELISEAAGPLGREDFTQVAQMVACLRARYLTNSLVMAKDCGKACIDTESALALKNHRIAYEEAKAAYDALEHALLRGYIEFDG
ncbi:MAG: hypothetical protein AAF387_13235 [Pseudomonadota bacterium]